jgi:integrase
MTIRKRVDRRTGLTHLVIDIRFRTADGRKLRYRKDAQLQTRSGAHAEERRLLVEFERTGELRNFAPEEPEQQSTSAVYTFADVLQHMRRVHLPQLKTSTRVNYEKRVALYIEPTFNRSTLAEMTPEAFAEFAAALNADGLAPSTRRGVLITLRSLLRRAVDAGMLGAMPKFPKMPRVGRKCAPPMRQEDVTALLKVVPANVALAFALAAYAGLRAGEVRALRWWDVDLRAGLIRVRRALSHGVESTPKSGEARPVPICAPLRALLEAAPKPRKDPHARVALTKHKREWGETGLTQAFARALVKAKLTGEWSFHDLRRFCATELERLGAPLSAVQKILGHADVTTTMIYIGVVERDLHTAMALFGQKAGATPGQQQGNEAEGTA